MGYAGNVDMTRFVASATGCRRLPIRWIFGFNPLYIIPFHPLQAPDGRGVLKLRGSLYFLHIMDISYAVFYTAAIIPIISGNW